MTHRLMHEQVGKCAKMYKSEESQTGGTKQARQAHQQHMEQRTVCIKHTNTTEVYLTGSYIKTSPRRDKCNNTKQVAPRTDKHKPTKGAKHGKT